jgi:hypothetical protein
MSKKLAREMKSYGVTFMGEDGEEDCLINIVAPSLREALAEALKRLNVELTALSITHESDVAVVE